MTHETTIRLREATPARWAAALARARAEGCRVFYSSGTGAAFVTSATKDATLHETDGEVCTCEAALLYGDPVCKHRAIYLHERGALPIEGEPVGTVRPTRAICPVCAGVGAIKITAADRRRHDAQSRDLPAAA